MAVFQVGKNMEATTQTVAMAKQTREMLPDTLKLKGRAKHFYNNPQLAGRVFWVLTTWPHLHSLQPTHPLSLTTYTPYWGQCTYSTF